MSLVMPLTFPFAKPPIAGELAEIIPGIRWACLPLPFALDHVNAWLLSDAAASSPAFVIDTGIDTGKTRQLWQDLIERYSILPEHLLITHYHPDHIGLAGWFEQQWQSRLIFSAGEYAQAEKAWHAADDDVRALLRPWYVRNGLDKLRVDMMAETGNSYRPLVAELPVNPQILKAGDNIDIAGTGQWRVLEGRGHSPEMICLYNAQHNVLIAADQILPSITPNISLTWYLADDNPMQSFLSSFEPFLALPEDVLVLPSHGLPFRGLHVRIAALRDHHDERFDSLVEFCSSGRSAADCLPHLFKRELDQQQLMFGMGESLAHLCYLHRCGRLTLVERDGIDLYQRPA